ncbi:phosphoribosylamine--glycine ligase [Halomarina oriensis]|uniref:phosphoribosylamine--glycine ligase n=1 Tax=Halomarina oriensis TaxID=671145 RepID=A0A6B0GLK0_9EURY|nr:phosphoribosylamine--glycine ligase [Halomarina oriensis]MWG33663.1 phosphoribosylamine--glycine ligase [Halomarina oriensis]
MNVLFASRDGLVGDIAWRVQREGHEVRYCVESESEGRIADGFVEKVTDWRDHESWADLVVFDDVWGYGAEAERLRAEGVPVVGGTALTDRLEDDRGFAQEVLADAGADVLPHREFTAFEAAREWVRENPAPYVIKPSGEVQNVKRLVYVGTDGNGGDVLDVLDAYEEAWGHRMKGFQLQRRAKGVEVAVSAFFDGESFVEPVCVNFEHKKLFPGNVGPSTGEMGTSAFWTERVELFDRTLGRCEDLLAEEGYVGSLDLNCIATPDGVHPLEFTPRFGYPTVFVQAESMETPLGAFFYGLATGDAPDLQVQSGYQVGVRVCVPPFPFDDDTTFRETSYNAAITWARREDGATDGGTGASESDESDPTSVDARPDGLHIEDVKRVRPDGTPTDPGERGQWRVEGSSGVVLTVAGCGETMRAAQRQAYERVSRIVLPSAYFRDDIADRWFEGGGTPRALNTERAGDGDRLAAWGYLR